MSRAIETLDPSDGAGPKAERQLVAAVERHSEVLASVQEVGRPEAGQHVAVKAVAMQHGRRRPGISSTCTSAWTANGAPADPRLLRDRGLRPSASTVECHLRKAFRKLDVKSRTQLED